MAYRIELGVDPDEGLYLELAIRNRATRGILDVSGVDHRLNVFGWADDYGCYGEYGVTVASNSNGLISVAGTGILCLNVPTTRLLHASPDAAAPAAPLSPVAVAAGAGPQAPNQGAPVSPPYAPFFGTDLRRSLRAKLLAVPADPTLTKTLATLVISLGGTVAPRITLDSYPLYPNAPTALTTCSVAQMKAQLAADGTLDAVNAALTGGPKDPAVIAWNTGGAIGPTGPLGTVIATITGKTPAQMVLYVASAALNPL